MATVTTQNEYKILLQQLRSEIEEGMQKAKNAFEQQKVLTYWRVGKSISLHITKHKENASIYGQRLIERLSGDLGISRRQLFEIKAFYEKYPNFTPSPNLNWSHYKVLASVKDEQKRESLECKVGEECLSKRQLETIVKSERIKPEPVKKAPVKKLYAYRGKLMTYELFSAPYSDELLLDLGMNTYINTGLKKFPTQFTEVSFKDGVPIYNKSDAKRSDRFTYKAYIEKIIDGDTLWVIWDVGFSMYLRQKVRLRGIEAPEIGTQEGKTLKHFVQDTLKGLPFVIIKSTTRDKFDRPLVDLYYL